MASRLAAVRQAQTPAPGESPAALSVAAAAEAALGREDLEAYAALWGEAAAIDDVHRRYQARCQLVEAALGAAIPPLRLPALYVQTAQVLLEVLEAEPREPVQVNYLGVLLYELGELGAATALFRAAKRMDPSLAHVDANLEQVARRRARRAPRPKLPAAVAVRLDELARRARRVADRARAAAGLTISLCMIVRDEEEMLGRCLDSVRSAVDEIVVVDTGSRDASREIARARGARVIDFEWTGCFAEARNVSLEHATGDWLLVLDADEVLVAEDVLELCELAGRTWREAFFLPETSFTGDLEDGMAAQHNALRLFRNRPEYRYDGLLHEQIGQCLPTYLPERLEVSKVRIEHYGYLGRVREAREKSRRNIELLERELETDGPTAFRRYNLGSEYAVAGRHEDAARELRASWSELQGESHIARYPYLPSLVDRLVRALRVIGECDEALAVADQGLVLFPGHTDLVLEQGMVHSQRADLSEAARCFERCLEMGDAPARYSPTRGSGSYLALVCLAEVRRRQARLAEAEALVRCCLAEHHGFPGAVLPLAQVLLDRGADPDRVSAAIADAVPELTPRVQFLIGTALYEAAHAAAAASHFRSVLAHQPSNRAVLVALAEAELSQRNWASAIGFAARVRGDHELGRAARRAELFGALAARRFDAHAVQNGLERAKTDSLAPEHLAVFEAWSAARAGTPLPDLSVAAAPLLGTVLEALLRVQELDRFAELVPAIDRTALPPRERRELLAGIYLRRGFLESAGGEWMAVCESSGPDVRALIGLAQVAFAQGARDDAIVFAEAVCGLEPDHAGASALLSRLAAMAS